MDKEKLWQFICKNKDLSEVEVGKLLKKGNYDLGDLIEIHNKCVYINIKHAAAKRAVEIAISFSDWLCIVENLYNTDHGGKALRTVLEMLLEHDIPNQDDVNLLRSSRFTFLNPVGWYLNGKRKFELAKKNPRRSRRNRIIDADKAIGPVRSGTLGEDSCCHHSLCPHC